MSKAQRAQRNVDISHRWINALPWLLACGLSTALVPTGMVLATPASPGFVSNPLGPTSFDELHLVNAGDANIQLKTKGDVDVWIVTNTVAPGAHSGWHTHPGPSLVTVQSGIATYYAGDDPICAPRSVASGQGFIDEGGGHIHLVRNEGTQSLVLIATQILPRGAPRRIDAPAPASCPAF